MGAGEKNNSLVEEIKLFIEYAVEEELRPSAISFMERYQNNQIAMVLLRQFYSTLPEAREEPVVRICRLAEQQGVCLLVIGTANHNYLSVASDTEAHILGEYASGKATVTADVLNYFSYESNEAFLKTCRPVNELEEFAFGVDEQTVCPACKTVEGAMHMLGCPVEVCPWCDGQLNRCNCRFEQLETEEVESDADVEKFLELLEARGRIPFKRQQQPAYPGSSAGLDTGRKE